MLERIVERAVAWAIANARLVIALFIALTVAAGIYAAHDAAPRYRHRAHDIAHLPWKQEQARINAAFPQNTGLLVVMIDSANPDSAEMAAAALFARMQARTDLFDTVRRPDGGPFFDRYGMMLQSTEKVQQTSNAVIRAQGYLGPCRRIPVCAACSTCCRWRWKGSRRKRSTSPRWNSACPVISAAVSSALTGGELPLCWRCLMIDSEVDPRELRKLILAQPIRDFKALQPGAKASAAVREMVKELGLTPDRGITVRLTGQVALNDEEFGTVLEGMGLALIASICWCSACCSRRCVR